MKFLYHGSQARFDVVKPQQAFGYGGEKDCQNVIYAVQAFDYAVPFSFTLLNVNVESLLDVDTSSQPPVIRLRNCGVDWSAKGYIYQLPMTAFEKIDDLQWVSKVEVEPVGVTEVDPNDYAEWFDIQCT